MTVLVSAVSFIQMQPVSATFPGANGKIAFTRVAPAAESERQIFTMNPDGSGLTQLTSDGANVWPRWSANGMKIVFQSNRITPADTDGSWEIWVMNADGSGQTQITFNASPVQNLYPAFSPDGSKIVFASDRAPSTNLDIWAMNADGSDPHRLTTDSAGEVNPVWSPDGSKIAFWRSGDIFVMNPDGSGQTDISTDQNATDEFPEWSPDGQMIAFDSFPSRAIWVMNADGSGRTQLSNPPSSPIVDLYPAWSPDGTKIAFFRGVDSIWVMNADGSDPVDITVSQPNSDTDFAPNWQPIISPVGGVAIPVNKLVILAPYLALLGLFGAVTVASAASRRRKT